MKKYLKAIAVMAIIGTTWACASNKTTTTTITSYAQKGNAVVSRMYSIKDFSGIKVHGAYNVYFTQGDTWSVRVETEEKQMDLIVLSKEKGQLVIKTKEGRSACFRETPKVFITAPDLSSVEIHGACNFFVENMQADKLTVKTYGSSDIFIEQLRANTFLGECHGSCDIKAVIDAIDCSISASGSADAKLKVKADDLTVKASGACDMQIDFTGKRGEVSCSGAGTINLHTDCEYLHARNSGASDFKISGTADETQIEASGTANIDTKELNQF